LRHDPKVQFRHAGKFSRKQRPQEKVNKWISEKSRDRRHCPGIGWRNPLARRHFADPDRQRLQRLFAINDFTQSRQTPE
jgi:hypothetical protein